MREFKVLASADSVDILRASLSQQQLEQYGDPVTPQYVYDAIAKLDRFNGMRVRYLQITMHSSVRLTNRSVDINRMLKNFSASSSKVSTMSA
jgi:hypothetical protein